jgi:hypothetical protein
MNSRMLLLMPMMMMVGHFRFVRYAHQISQDDDLLRQSGDFPTGKFQNCHLT